MSISRLLVSEQFFLLSLDDKPGHICINNTKDRIKWGLAAGLLISLIKLEKISFDGNHIVLQDPSLTDDDLLNKILFLLTSSSHNKSIEFWLHQIILEIKDITDIIILRLIKKGYLQKFEEKSKFGSKMTFKLLKSNFKQKMIPRLKLYLAGDRRPSFVYRGLICLMDSCALDRIISGWDMKKTRGFYRQFKYCSNPRVKKFFFLAKLKIEIQLKTRLSLYN